MKQNALVLLTAEYAKRGGIGTYFRTLIEAGLPADVVVTRAEEAAGMRGARVLQNVDERDRRWWRLVRVCGSLWREGYETILITHILPIGTAAWIASFFQKGKYVIFLHGLDLRLSQRTAWKRWLSRRILVRAVGVVVNSAATEAFLARAIPSIKPLRLLPALPSSTPTSNETAVHVPEGAKRIILTMGRLVSRKGFDTAIETLTLLPEDVHLVIIGDGPDRERLERLVSEKGLRSRVHFCGQVTEEEKHAWLASADLFLFLPRDEGADVEGFGMVCLEAAEAGLPVVVGDEGGVREAIVPGKTGVIVPARDVSAIADAVSSLLNDDVRRRALSQAGALWVEERFSAHDRVQVFTDWMTHL